MISRVNKHIKIQVIEQAGERGHFPAIKNIIETINLKTSPCFKLDFNDREGRVK